MLPSPAPDSCVLILVRHGATSANLAVPHVLQGCGVDLSLCDVGMRQAEQVASFLAPHSCDAIFSSGLKRAMETAERIAARQDCRRSLRERQVDRGAIDHNFVETIAGVHVVDVGRWEGRDWDEIQRNDVDAHRRFMDDPATHGYPEGETIVDVAQRVTPIFEALGKQHLGKRIIVVAHNIVLRAYLASLLGIPLAQYRRITQENCCVNVVVWSGAGMMVKTVNATFHLGTG